MSAGRYRFYKDEVLKTRAFRISEKYELKYIHAFIKILRKFRKQAIEFVEKYSEKISKDNKNN